uniref:thiol oxidase n=1 Tax=viral metagenome TaxID=1070528 RepID=A0A6C0F3B8_9ZZZZ
MALDPKVWGPHYWFMLHTIAMSYPNYPNTVTKKKYYEFIQNLPMFLPIESIATDFSKLLDVYPVTPYLDSKDAFIRWMHFIHNKINEKLEKPKISLNQFYIDYYEAYKPKDLKTREYIRMREKIIYCVVLILILGLSYYLYNK